MAIMIRVSKTIDGNWEQTLGMHTTTYHPTPIHRGFDTRAGVYGGSMGRVWGPGPHLTECPCGSALYTVTAEYRKRRRSDSVCIIWACLAGCLSGYTAVNIAPSRCRLPCSVEFSFEGEGPNHIFTQLLTFCRPCPPLPLLIAMNL